MRTSLQRRTVRGFYLAQRWSVSRLLLGPPEGVEGQRQDLLPRHLARAEVAGPRHDPAATPRGPHRAATPPGAGARSGTPRAPPAVLFATDIGDGGEPHGVRVPAGVQEPVGGPEEGPKEEEARSPEREHAPRPLQEVGGDVLEHGAGHAAHPAQREMGPSAAGAAPPDVQGEVPRPSPQEREPVFHVTVEEPLHGAAAAEAWKVEGQDVIAGGAQRLDAPPQVEVGLPPDQPGGEEEDGAAGALRRKPDRRQGPGPAPPGHGHGLERGQILPRLGRGRGRKLWRQKQEQPHREPLLAGSRPERHGILGHGPLCHSLFPPHAHMDISRGEELRRYTPGASWSIAPLLTNFKQCLKLHLRWRTPKLTEPS